MRGKDSGEDRGRDKRRALIPTLLLAWWDQDHRDLPWRQSRDPYVTWIAEVMLQQTQISTVIPYYDRWLAKYPTVQHLAAASLDDVLKLWEGLGYYGRARNLHRAARTVVEKHGGKLPSNKEGLQALPGIGRYTAGAIASIAFNQPVPVVDGNITRVLTRLFDLDGDVTRTDTIKTLWRLAAGMVPPQRPGDYNQALMELGQEVCLPVRPSCHTCPLNDLCLARNRGTQLDRPVRPPRKRLPHYDVTAAVIWNESGQFLITKRPLEGLLGGLWEFPGGKREPGESLEAALIREINEELDIQIEVERPMATIKHAYTHFRITLYPFHARLRHGRPSNIGVADHRWVDLAGLEFYAFAATDRQIIQQLTLAVDSPTDHE